MRYGTIKSFHERKGHGFIQPDDGSAEVYVAVRDIEAEDRNLSEGDRVEFETVQGTDGLKAIEVRREP